jgi:CBS domain-containing protein
MHANDPVNRIMSEPVLSIGPDEPVSELLRLFIAYPVHHLPVVQDRRVVGMLSSADLLKLEFFLPPPGPARDKLLDDRFRVSKVMRTPVVTVTEHDTLQRASELMAANGIHSLPVVNGDDHIVGIVTTTDLMHAFMRNSGGTFAASGAGAHTQPVDSRFVDALNAARQIANTDQDSNGIAMAFLQLQQRTSALESVAHTAKRYINAGQDERLHASLCKAIERLDHIDSAGSATMLGLDAR